MYQKKLRASLEEFWRNMEHGPGGEYACCGVFQTRFTEGLTRADENLSPNDKIIIIRMIKEVGYGARSLMKLHSEINQPERISTMRQPLIKEFMVRLDIGAQEGTNQLDCELIQKGDKRKYKRTIRRSKYVNPCPDESDTETPVIMFPPSPSQVFSKYIAIKKNKYGGVVN